jgi:hypothetical protein
LSKKGNEHLYPVHAIIVSHSNCEPSSNTTLLSNNSKFERNNSAFLKTIASTNPDDLHPYFENADVLDKNKFVTKNSYAIHYWNATWVDPWSLLWAGRFKSGWSVIMKTLLNKPLQSRAFYKNVLFHVKCAIVGYPK